MLYLKPIPEHEASEDVKKVYSEIKELLGAPVVPQVFQYIANYERYLQYMWERIRANLLSEQFSASHAETVLFTKVAVSSIYSPSPHFSTFVKTLHPHEKKHIEETAYTLEQLNGKMVLIMLAVREEVKGLFSSMGPQLYLSKGEEETIERLFQSSMVDAPSGSQEVENMSKMLAPLFGNSSLTISQYPAFFSHVSFEMEELVKSVEYLALRVELERRILKASENFPYSFGCSYSEVISLTRGKPHLHELIYLLSNTFPTQFPRLMFTSSVMKRILNEESGIVPK